MTGLSLFCACSVVAAGLHLRDRESIHFVLILHRNVSFNAADLAYSKQESRIIIECDIGVPCSYLLRDD